MWTLLAQGGIVESPRGDRTGKPIIQRHAAAGVRAVERRTAQKIGVYRIRHGALDRGFRESVQFPHDHQNQLLNHVSASVCQQRRSGRIPGAGAEAPELGLDWSSCLKLEGGSRLIRVASAACLTEQLNSLTSANHINADYYEWSYQSIQ
jgi:hypothetical protein